MLDLAAIEARIGYVFRCKDLLERAFTHASYANTEGIRSYDRLEFLGDSVLGLVVAETMCDDSCADEGRLTVARSTAVRQAALTETFDRLNLSEFVLLAGTKPPAKAKIWSDVYEAVVGAIYSDGGLEAAREFVLRTHGESIRRALREGRVDYKTQLQELVQSRERRGTAAIEYRSVEAAERDGVRTFVEAAYLHGEELARGAGASKKEAQQQAACLAMRQLKS